jgi:hypothetical protein
MLRSARAPDGAAPERRQLSCVIGSHAVEMHEWRFAFCSLILGPVTLSEAMRAR